MVVIGLEDPTEEQERLSGAYHEAGHVAILRHFGIRVVSATIVPPRHALAEDLPEDFDPRSRTEHEELARQHIICSHAGKAAELKGCGTEPTAADGDLVRAFRVAAIVLGEDMAHPTGASFAYVEALLPAAIDLLDHEDVWADVETISQALLARDTLLEPDIVNLLGR